MIKACQSSGQQFNCFCRMPLCPCPCPKKKKKLKHFTLLTASWIYIRYQFHICAIRHVCVYFCLTTEQNLVFRNAHLPIRTCRKSTRCDRQIHHTHIYNSEKTAQSDKITGKSNSEFEIYVAKLICHAWRIRACARRKYDEHNLVRSDSDVNGDQKCMKNYNFKKNVLNSSNTLHFVYIQCLLSLPMPFEK